MLTERPWVHFYTPVNLSSVSTVNTLFFKSIKVRVFHLISFRVMHTKCPLQVTTFTAAEVNHFFTALPIIFTLNLKYILPPPPRLCRYNLKLNKFFPKTQLSISIIIHPDEISINRTIYLKAHLIYLQRLDNKRQSGPVFQLQQTLLSSAEGKNLSTRRVNTVPECDCAHRGRCLFVIITIK